ncbi:TIGR00730 family Rossman fold protein [Paenibacillus campi]|uniref:LOG family protein n=1 Tax=Paenibacillus campi TaxID=3106031 RepID=UPI002B00135D|nr:TIGR00730 family Rossman fold protein [Paenibacillus sp. SGZ-1014]
MRSICVFAGSGTGHHPEYMEQASRLGSHIAGLGYQLIYGGSRLGLMGAVADAALSSGGQVVGIMPGGLLHGERAHQGLTELIRVDSMHERKALMQETADAFIALPGGLGTLEELFEVLCWSQIGIHNKPLGLYNIRGYYDPLLHMLRHSIEEGFTGASCAHRLVVSTDPQELIQAVSHELPPTADLRWQTASYRIDDALE